MNKEGIIAFTKSVQKPVSEASPLSKFLIDNFNRNTMMNLPMNVVIVELIMGKMKNTYEDLGCLCYFIKKYNVTPELGNIRWLWPFPKKEIKKAIEAGIVKQHDCTKKINCNENVMNYYYDLTREAYKKYSEMDKNHLLEEKYLAKYKGQADEIGRLTKWKKMSMDELSESLNYHFLSWAVYYIYENYSLKEREEIESYNAYFE